VVANRSRETDQIDQASTTAVGLKTLAHLQGPRRHSPLAASRRARIFEMER
jgi:hypothetical protein